MKFNFDTKIQVSAPNVPIRSEPATKPVRQVAHTEVNDRQYIPELDYVVDRARNGRVDRPNTRARPTAEPVSGFTCRINIAGIDYTHNRHEPAPMRRPFGVRNTVWNAYEYYLDIPHGLFDGLLLYMHGDDSARALPNREEAQLLFECVPDPRAFGDVVDYVLDGKYEDLVGYPIDERPIFSDERDFLAKLVGGQAWVRRTGSYIAGVHLDVEINLTSRIVATVRMATGIDQFEQFQIEFLPGDLYTTEVIENAVDRFMYNEEPPRNTGTRVYR